jgi:hypothetical protein
MQPDPKFHVLAFPFRYPRSNELIPSPPIKAKNGKWISRSFFSYNHWRQTWHRVIQQCPPEIQPKGRRRITVTRQYSGRERPMDPWNLYTAGKLILDALVANGWLLDDDQRGVWPDDHPLRSSCRQQKGSTTAIMIQIEDATEGP